MSAFAQLAWHSAALAAAVLLAAALFRVWRRHPVAAYRAARAVVVAALALPVAALALQALRTAMPVPVEAHASVAPASAGELAAPRPGTRGEQRPAASPPPAPLPVEQRPAAGPTAHEPAAPPLAAALLLPVLDELAGGWAAQSAQSFESSLHARLPGALRIGSTTVWALGALFGVALVLRRVRGTRRLLARSRAVTCPATLAAWRRVRSGSGIASRVQLRESHELSSPASAGRSTVLLPPADRLPPGSDALECALLHELVHLERRDTAAALLLELFAGVFWFHPAAWWLRRRTDALRELSCDELTVQRSGHRRRYAEALLEYAAALNGRANPTAASLLSWTSTPGQLTRRIEMLIERRTPSSIRARALPTLAAAGLFGALWSGQLAMASASPAAPPEAVDPEVTPALDDQDVRFSPIYFGITIGRPGDALAAMVGAEADELILVERVYDGSAAERAGLERWDVITRIDGGPATRSALQAARGRLADGATVDMDVRRRGARVAVEVRPSAEEDAAFSRRFDRGSSSAAQELLRDARTLAQQGQVAEAYERWAELLERKDEWEELDVLTEAQRFYRGLDGEQMGEFLADASEVLQNALREGDIPAQYAEQLGLLHELRGRDLDEYVETVREYLGQVDPKRFRKDFLKALKRERKALENSQGGSAARVRGLLDAISDPEPPADRLDLEAALRDAQRQIAAQKRRIDDLSEKVDELLALIPR